MNDFDALHPIHLYGLNLMIVNDEFDDSPATFIPCDSGSDRALHDDE